MSQVPTAQKKKSSAKESPKIPCTEAGCTEKFQRPYDMKRHKREVHDKAFRDCPVDTCSHSEKRAYRLNEHIRGTHPERADIVYDLDPPQSGMAMDAALAAVPTTDLSSISPANIVGPDIGAASFPRQINAALEDSLGYDLQLDSSFNMNTSTGSTPWQTLPLNNEGSSIFSATFDGVRVPMLLPAMDSSGLVVNTNAFDSEDIGEDSLEREEEMVTDNQDNEPRHHH